MKTLEQTFHELTALISDQTRDLAMAMAELRSVAAERDKHAQTIAAFVDADDAKERWKPPVNERMGELYGRLFVLTDERDTARQSLRAAEQDCDDMQSINSDLRTANARLVADLATAMERLNHAESIIMQ